MLIYFSTLFYAAHDDDNVILDYVHTAVSQLHRNGIDSIIYSSLFTIKVVEYNKTLTTKLN